jgi:DNA-binding Lrp family transcriptional regulator
MGYVINIMAKNDQINDHILRVLREDGRISNLDLAERVGLSPSASLRRVQELERSGVIKGYRAVLDRSKQGIGFLAYIGVGLNDHSKAAQAAFERAMDRADDVTECHNITGNYEYMLRVECQSLEAYKTFHTDFLGAQPHVGQITTFVVLGSSKDARG